MKLHRCLIFSIAVAGLLLVQAFSAGEAQAEAKIGVSAAIRGNVFVKSGSSAQRRAQQDQSIRLQDEVLTKRQSALQILLLDESVFTVGENCEMVIDRFVYDPDKKAGEMSSTIVKGAFRFMSGRIGKSNPTKASVVTPSATIGIRGTFFEGAVGLDAITLARLLGLPTANADNDKALFVVLRGEGRNKNTLGNTGIITVGNSAGSKTISSPGYAVFVPGPGLPPIGPIPITDEILAYFDHYLRTLPFGPSEGGGEQTGGSQSGQENFNEPGSGFQGFNDAFFDELFDNQNDPMPMDDDDYDPYSYRGSY
ncbi:MAG: FecR domain-containing protein [Alphaproteobacteria bacterium]|nr:FecR domain-containing protein [Alphaproteobacteria bacterium]